ncbi:MAG TPA: GAF domain-containing protein [Chitinophagaceae bacterium]|jgi:L-methionine (R)-S-oxide reductase|nr:GAF domain-containing protein [Chitinophagaceae bacterium]
MEVSFSEILKSDNPRNEKARLIADKICMSKGYPWAGVYDVKENEIKIVSCAGRSEPLIPSFPKDKGLNGRAVMQGRTVVVNDIDKDEDYLLTFTNTKSEIVVPVFDKTGKQIVGTIDVEGEKTNAFSDDDVKFLEDCARKISELWS